LGWRFLLRFDAPEKTSVPVPFAVLFLLLLINVSGDAEESRGDPVVLQVREKTIVFSVPADSKLKPGDELTAFSANTEPLLVKVTELFPEAGIARIIYGKPNPGDSLAVRPALGLEVQSYVGGLITFSGTFSAVPGIRISGSRGFSGLFPVAGLEFPLSATSVQGFPVFPYAGMQLQWDIGRFQIIPSGLLGLGIYLSNGSGVPYFVDYLGGIGEIGISYLFHDSWRILLGLGYSSWVGRAGLEEDDRYGYNGVTLRGGLIWKM